MEKKHLFSLRSLPIGKILLLFLLIYIALLAIPYIQHKNVSVSYQKKFAKQSFYSDTAGTERVAYINDNTDALLYRLHMLDEAKDEIILSTFDFNADKSGQDMMASLLHAADRGVSVRILVDRNQRIFRCKTKSLVSGTCLTRKRIHSHLQSYKSFKTLELTGKDA